MTDAEACLGLTNQIQAALSAGWEARSQEQMMSAVVLFKASFNAFDSSDTIAHALHPILQG